MIRIGDVHYIDPKYLNNVKNKNTQSNIIALENFRIYFI